MKKNKIPGRRKLKCIRCEKEFSTHSSNRDKCYKCVPKCKEIHEFPNKKKVQKPAEKNNSSIVIEIKDK